MERNNGLNGKEQDSQRWNGGESRLTYLRIKDVDVDGVCRNKMIRHRIELELRSSDARIAIFTDHGEQEEKLSETRTTLAHLANPVAWVWFLQEKLGLLVAS